MVEVKLEDAVWGKKKTNNVFQKVHSDLEYSNKAHHLGGYILLISICMKFLRHISSSTPLSQASACPCGMTLAGELRCPCPRHEEVLPPPHHVFAVVNVWGIVTVAELCSGLETQHLAAIISLLRNP